MALIAARKRADMVKLELELFRKGDGYIDYPFEDASVRVFYDPADPDRVRLDWFDEMWFNVLALGGLTLFAGLLAAAAWGTLRQARP